MEEYIGKICPFCKTVIKEGDAVKVCPSCNTAHHEACWEQNKGCSTFGCSEQHSMEQHTDPNPVEQHTDPNPVEQHADPTPVEQYANPNPVEQYANPTPVEQYANPNPVEQQTNPNSVCANCGTPMEFGQAFCPKCGAPNMREEVKKNICGNCGTELQEGQVFCPKCGHKSDVVLNADANNAINQFNDSVAKKKKKRILVPIIIVASVLVVAVVAGVIAFVSIQQQKQKEKEEAIANYISTAKSFYSATLEAGDKMETIGNEIQDNWHTYVFDNGYYIKKFDSVDDAVRTANAAQSSNIKFVESKKPSIESMYSTLSKVPEGSDLGDVKSAVTDTYDAFDDMYDCVMDVDGNYNTYTSEFKETDSALSKALNKLNNTLKSH